VITEKRFRINDHIGTGDKVMALLNINCFRFSITATSANGERWAECMVLQ
jgi:hypothetical protein